MRRVKKTRKSGQTRIIVGDDVMLVTHAALHERVLAALNSLGGGLFGIRRDLNT